MQGHTFPYIHFANNAEEAVSQIPVALDSQTPPRDIQTLLESLTPKFAPLEELL